MTQDSRTQNAKAVEQTRNFLSALFMGVRTAHIHDPSNKAFETSIRNLRDAAEALFNATGGFAVQFVEDSAFLNGQRIKFASGAFESMRELRISLESKELGGIEMRSIPTFEAIKKLIMMFSRENAGATGIKSADLSALGFNVLGIQKFSEGEKAGLKIDRRVFALQCYAKLILALREQRERIEREREVDWASGPPPAPKLRSVRVVQDMIELTADRLDFLLKLSASRVGASPAELHGANTCVVSLALGHALGLNRQELVEIGIAGLFHDAARAGGVAPGPESPPGSPTRKVFNDDRGPTDASFVRMLSQTGVAGPTRLRSIIVAERRVRAGDAFPWGKPRPPPHIFSRIVGVASAYCGLTTGATSEEGVRHRPLDALAILMADAPRVDPRLVDLLINMLRAFPVGCEVLLDDERRAVVRAHRPAGRWDRPIVVFEDATSLDLMLRDGDRFLHRVAATARYLGLEPKLEGLFREEAEEAPPEAQLTLEPATDDDDLVLALPVEDDAPPPDEKTETPPSEPPDEPQLVAEAADAPEPEAEPQAAEETEAEEDTSAEPVAFADDGFNEKTPTEDVHRATQTSQELTPPPAPEEEEDDPFPSGSLDEDDMSPAVTRAVARVRAARQQANRVPAGRRPPSRFDTELLSKAPPEASGIPPELAGWAQPSPSPKAPISPAKKSRNLAEDLEPRQAEPDFKFGYRLQSAPVGNGAVLEYEAFDPADESPVLIRTFDRSAVDDSILPAEAQLKLFERECLVGAKLAHPVLPRLIDLGQSGSVRYVVYERSLGQPLDKCTLLDTPAKIRRVLRSLSEALAHMHDRSLLMCDLRPAQIRIADDLTPRFASVHMALPQGESPNPLLHSLPTILAPEFLAGRPYHAAADQFALGVLGYQLLVGRPPWPGNWAVVDPSQPGPRPIIESTPQAGIVLSELIGRMLERDPNKRLDSCDSAARQLTRAPAIARRRAG